MKNLILFLVVLVGCSGEDEPEPCDLAHRKGTYLQVAKERSGDCGPLPDQVTRLDGELPAECTLDAPDEISADQCKVSRSWTCAIASPPGSVQAVGVSTERDAGARLTGIITMTIRDGAGDYVCSGTYDVMFTRQ